MDTSSPSRSNAQPVAWVAGATGLIGRELLALLGGNAHALVRRPVALPASGVNGTAAQHVVDWNALDVSALPIPSEAYCALGTTIKQAGSQNAFRAVDFDSVLAFASAAKAAGAQRLAVVSALGANSRSGVFYNRVKGEMEAALGAMDFATLVVARPSLLLGDRAALGQPTRLGERLGMALTRPLGGLIPASVRPIEAHTVALAMVNAMREPLKGIRILESGTLRSIGRQRAA